MTKRTSDLLVLWPFIFVTRNIDVQFLWSLVLPKMGVVTATRKNNAFEVANRIIISKLFFLSHLHLLYWDKSLSYKKFIFLRGVYFIINSILSCFQIAFVFMWHPYWAWTEPERIGFTGLPEGSGRCDGMRTRTLHACMLARKPMQTMFF